MNAFLLFKAQKYYFAIYFWLTGPSIKTKGLASYFHPVPELCLGYVKGFCQTNVTSTKKQQFFFPSQKHSLFAALLVLCFQSLSFALPPLCTQPPPALRCTRTFSQTSMLLLLLLSLEISHPNTLHTALWSRQHKRPPRVTNESAGFWCLRTTANTHARSWWRRRAVGFIIIADFQVEGLLLN